MKPLVVSKGKAFGVPPFSPSPSPFPACSLKETSQQSLNLSIDVKDTPWQAASSRPAAADVGGVFPDILTFSLQFTQTLENHQSDKRKSKPRNLIDLAPSHITVDQPAKRTQAGEFALCVLLHSVAAALRAAAVRLTWLTECTAV